MAADRGRQAANVAGAVAQIAASALVPLGVLPIAVGERTEAVDTPVVPADYAFAIWGLIFATCLAYAVWQALPGRRKDATPRRIGWWTAAAFAGNTVWQLAAQSGAPDWSLALVIVPTAGAALGALLRLADAPERVAGARWLLVALPVGVLAGWLSAATFANLSTALEASRVEAWPQTVWLALIGGAAVFASAVLLRVRGQPAYAAAVLWALFGIAAANRAEGEPVALQLAIAGLLIVALATILGRPRARRAAPARS
jgi:hypothetical protein